MAHDLALAARIRTRLAGLPDVEEKQMVGGVSFVVGGHLCVGVSGDSLLVRVGPADYERTLAEPHVSPLKMGAKHPIGYVLVDPAGSRSDADLAAWIDRGLRFVASLPRPKARTTR
jgi:TfoX/Sxy family transcriptional regulator of competence genes